ncbi:O-acetyltransferase OatA [Aphelenchoides bicaudatus]|nr:O-acetyltransferase OatA [Aphelenchoides bicaudatus]
MLLTNTFLVQLGDISYSVYMVHWMIFEAHKYYNKELYAFKNNPEITILAMLILSSILLGYVVEKSYSKLSNYIQNWKTLLAVIATLYLLIFATMYYLNSNVESDKMVLKKYEDPLNQWSSKS